MYKAISFILQISALLGNVSAGGDHLLEQDYNTVDRLCHSTNTVDGVCTISQKSMRMTSNFYYRTELSLIFESVELSCVTTKHDPCFIFFRLDGEPGQTITLKGDTKFEGNQVVIDGVRSRVEILDNSQLAVSGQSHNTNGTSSNHTEGATYIGEGGNCLDKRNRRVYGEFDMMPRTSLTNGMTSSDVRRVGSQMGSMGRTRDVESAGGGRIIVRADSLKLQGSGAKMNANAHPLQDYYSHGFQLPGGSGGYVYLTTLEVHAKNEIDGASTIESRGGYGFGGAYGGAGGVVVVDGSLQISEERVFTDGGLQVLGENVPSTSIQGCENGAAGTLFYRQNDLLVVNNRNHSTTMKTHIKPPRHRNNLNGGSPRIIADDLKVRDKGHAFIVGGTKHLSFETVEMTGGAYISVMDAHPKSVFEIYFRRSVDLDPESTLDFSKSQGLVLNITGVDDPIGRAQGDNSTHYSKVKLGNIIFNQDLGIVGEDIVVAGKLSSTFEHDPKIYNQTTIIVMGEHVTLKDTADLQAAYMMLQANKTFYAGSGAKIESTLTNKCNFRATMSDLFNCIPHNYLGDKLDGETFVQSFNTQFDQDFTRIGQTLPFLLQNFTIYIAAFEKLSAYEATIQGPRIGLCAPEIDLMASVVDASGRGCKANHGIGNSDRKHGCGGSGGAHGGIAGYGGTNPNNHEKGISGCVVDPPEPYFYQEQARYEGSGGSDGLGSKGGDGGGIIWISASNTIDVYHSEFKANGEDGTLPDDIIHHVGAGGGAGGSIQIVTKELRGNSDIEVKGGNGSQMGGGGGSGGRFVMVYLKSFLISSYPQMSSFWTGTHATDGGAGGLTDGDYLPGGDGQAGSTLTSKCFGGYSGTFCQPCPVGTFKFDFSQAKCKACDSAPDNAFYTQSAWDTSECPYQCNDGYEDSEFNPLCLDSLQLQYYTYSESISTLAVFGGICFLTLFMFMSLLMWSGAKKSAISERNSSVYDGVLFNTDAEIDRSEPLTGPRQLEMNDSDIWSHAHRMYLLGDNSISFPWFIPKDFPSQALDPSNKESFLKYLKHKQRIMDWSEQQRGTYLLFQCIFPPLAPAIHKCFRNRHYRALQDSLYTNFDSEFWTERNNKTFRVSTSTDNHQLAYIDFLNYNKHKKNYLGPQLPMTLLLAGSGTFNNPFYLNFENDSLAKSLVYLHQGTMKKKLPLFFENLNTLLAKTSFYKLTRQTMHDLDEAIEWVEIGNKTLFNQLDTKAQLYVFENTYSMVEGGFRQRRRSLPLESLVFEAFPEMYKNLIKYIQSKLLVKRCEIRLGLVIKPFTYDQNTKLQDKIRKAVQEMQDVNNRLGDDLLLFAEDEDLDQEDQALLFRTKPVVPVADANNREGNLGKMDRYADENDRSQELRLMNESLEESQVYIHGAPSGQASHFVKIVDKSKRAFSISLDSTKAFEIRLNTKKDTCKHKCRRFKGSFYSVWLLCFKHHGKPPSEHSLNCFMLLFALIMSLDVLATAIFMMHLFQPVINLKSVGIPFLCLYPLMPVLAPILGVAGSLCGSPKALKIQSSMNACCVVVNYPLTIFAMFFTQQESFYIAVVLFLWFNKILISFVGAKVRQHLLNPGFARNQEKMEHAFLNLTGTTSKNRPSMKNHYQPPVKVSTKDQQEDDNSDEDDGPSTMASRAATLAERRPPQLSSAEDLDDESSDEDDTSFGIIPTKKLTEGEGGHTLSKRLRDMAITNLGIEDEVDRNSDGEQKGQEATREHGKSSSDEEGDSSDW